ncbi:hypothetical protein THAOC_23102, partial [Thalassiosira oceanica]
MVRVDTKLNVRAQTTVKTAGSEVEGLERVAMMKTGTPGTVYGLSNRRDTDRYDGRGLKMAIPKTMNTAALFAAALVELKFGKDPQVEETGVITGKEMLTNNPGPL